MATEQLFICIQDGCPQQRIVNNNEYQATHLNHRAIQLNEFQQTLSQKIHLKSFDNNSIQIFSQDRTNKLKSSIMKRVETLSQYSNWVQDNINKNISNVQIFQQAVQILLAPQQNALLRQIGPEQIQLLCRFMQDPNPLLQIENYVQYQQTLVQQQQLNLNQVGDQIDLILETCFDSLYTNPNKWVILEKVKNEELESQFKECQKKVTQMEEKIEKYNYVIQKITVDEFMAKQEISKLQKQVEDSMKLNKETEDVIKEIKYKYQEKQFQLDQMQVTFMEKVEELANLNQCLNKGKTQLEMCQIEIQVVNQKLNQSNSEKDSEIQQLRLKNQEQISKLANLDKLKLDYEKNIKKLKSSLDLQQQNYNNQIKTSLLENDDKKRQAVLELLCNLLQCDLNGRLIFEKYFKKKGHFNC